MNVREWHAKQSDAVKALKVSPALELNLLSLLGVVCWVVTDQRDWHDEEPIVVGFTERGANAMQVADERVKAIQKAKLTVPPDVEFNKVLVDLVIASIETDNRSVEFQVGPHATVHYTKRLGNEQAAGELTPDSSAVRELFRWVATGSGQWVA